MVETCSDNARLTPYFFAIEVEGIQCAIFKKCEGLEIYNDIFEYEEGEYNVSTRKFIGQVHFQNIVLERGISYNRSLFDWFHYTTLWDNEKERKHGSIILMDSSWKEMRRWNFFRAFPCRWVGPSLKAELGTEYPIEKIEIVYDFLEEDKDDITSVIADKPDANIKRAFNKLKYSEFGNTKRGREIVNVLSKYYDKIAIVGTLPEMTRGRVRYIVDDNTGKMTINAIEINSNIPEEALPGRLAHEGTHLVYREQGIVDNTFIEEREAFDNGYTLDMELDSPVKDNPTDLEIRFRYPKLN